MAPDLARTLSELKRATPVEGLERGRLRPIEVAAQSIAAAAPAAGLVTTPSLVQATGAPAATATVVATVLILLVASSINQFTRRFAAPGSLYTCVVRGLGPLAGLATAGALSAGYLFVSLSSLVGAASYLSRGLALLGAPGVAVPGAEAVLAGVLALGVGALVLVGVRRTTLALLAIEVVAIGAVATALVLAVGVGLADVPDAAALGAHSWVADSGPSALGAGVVIALTAFIGFESASALGTEAQRPMRTVPRVITWTVAGLGALLAAGTMVQSTAFRALGIEPSANPVDDILLALGLPALLPAVDFAVMASFLACATASMIALVRVIMALAIDGVLPAAFGVPHPVWRTPHRAALVLLPVLCGVPVVLLAVGVPVRAAMDQLIQVSVLGYLTAYLLISLSVLRFLPRIGERTLRPTLIAGTAGVGLGAALIGYLAGSLGKGEALPITVVGAFVLLAVGWWFRTRTLNPDVLSRLGSYDEPSASSIWWGPSPTVPPAPDAPTDESGTGAPT